MFPFQGGMKAVIWTDVFMFVVIQITIILVLTMGSIESGGMSRVWQINKDAGRLDIFRCVLFLICYNTLFDILRLVWCLNDMRYM